MALSKLDQVRTTHPSLAPSLYVHNGGEAVFRSFLGVLESILNDPITITKNQAVLRMDSRSSSAIPQHLLLSQMRCLRA